jgi:hypothetical protein
MAAVATTSRAAAARLGSTVTRASACSRVTARYSASLSVLQPCSSRARVRPATRCGAIPGHRAAVSLSRSSARVLPGPRLRCACLHGRHPAGAPAPRSGSSSARPAGGLDGRKARHPRGAARSARRSRSEPRAQLSRTRSAHSFQPPEEQIPRSAPCVVPECPNVARAGPSRASLPEPGSAARPCATSATEDRQRGIVLAVAPILIRGSGLPSGLITGVEAISDRSERPPIQCRIPV